MILTRKMAVLAGFAALFAANPEGAKAQQLADRIGIVAHRGASVKFPEHTRPAYEQAVADGADFIEIDLVPTRDGALIARHENELSDTTDIADRPEFRDRRTTKTIDGRSRTGWFSEDFTLAEIRTLRAKERWPELRGSAEDGRHPVLTMAEIIGIAAESARASGRTIGLAPEIKHSTYFRSIGLATEDRLLAALRAHAYTRSAPVLIQSFEIDNLRYLRTRIARGSNLRLLQLIGRPDRTPADQQGKPAPLSYADLLTAEGLRDVARYADSVDPGKARIIPLGADDRLASPTDVVRDAHAAGLTVVPGVFRPENRFLPANLRDGPAEAHNRAGSIAEIHAFLKAGMDFVFTDDPEVAAEAIRTYERSRAK